MRGNQIPEILLRLGVAFSFLYPPYAALQDPVSWIGYIPQFMRALPIDQMFILHGFGVIEVLIALWILSGWRIFLPSLAASVILSAIVLANLHQFDVLFRDLSLAAMALALALGKRDAS